MKIVEIIPSLEKRAGAEVFVTNLSKELSKTNTVSIISLYDDIDKALYDSLQEKNIRVFKCGKRKGLDFRCSRHLRKLLNEISPDIVHLHLNSILTYYFATGIRKQRFKTFLTVHSLVKKDFKSIECFLMKRMTNNKSLTIVGISNLITEDIKKEIPNALVKTVFNGTELFTETISILDNKPLSIVNIAAFREEKNQALLIKCFSLLQKDFRDLRLVFVGGGEKESECKSLVKKLKLNNIVFNGIQNDVLPFLIESSVFCLSSIYEGNPISIIEAMSVGLPIVAPRVGGIPDVVENGVNGLLFTVNDEKELVKSLKTILSNTEIRLQMKKNNIDKSKSFSIESCAQQYEKIFNGD